MYNSQYYTCEQIDQRLLQGYLDDYNTENNTSLTKAEFLAKLGSILGVWKGVDDEPIAGSEHLVKSEGVFSSIHHLQNEANSNYIGYIVVDSIYDIKGKINNDGTWNDTINYRSQIVKCNPNSILEITPNGGWAQYAFLINPELTEGVAPNYVEGEDNYIQITTTTIVTVPADAKYMYIYVGTSDERYKVPYIRSKDKDIIMLCEHLDTEIQQVYDTIGREQPSVTIRSGGGFRITQNKIYYNIAAAWDSLVVSVYEGDVVKIKTTQYGSTYCGYIITDYDGIVIDKLNPTETSSNSIIEETVTIPKGGAVLYVNNHTNQILEHPVIDRLTYNSNKELSLTIKFAAINCGKFDYSDGQTTDAEYLLNWHKALNALDYDIIVLSDYIDKFGTLTGKAVDLLFDNQYCRYMNLGIDANLIVLSRIKNIADVSLVEVTQQVGEQTTHRHTVYKLIITFDNYKKVYLYCVHLAPGGDYGDIRAAQYQDIIDMINENNESAIIAGDYNANAASEYDVFKAAGLNLGNCDYTGEYDSLRNIPTDNIIVTPDIIIKNFVMLEDYNLNTDHKPIRAKLLIQN